MRHNPYLLLIILLTLARPAFAQKGTAPWTHDHQLWLQFQVTEEITHKWILGVEEELRLDKNVHRAQRLITEVTFRYRIIEPLKIGPLYRFAYKFHDPHVHRVGADLTYSPKLPFHFKLDTRTRYQVEFEKGSEREHAIRERVYLIYDKHKVIKPYIGTELFFAFRNASDNGFYRYRLFLGSNIKINDHHTIVVTYMSQVERFDNLWAHTYRIGYQLNFLKKAKEQPAPTQ
jgi:hypothetical protein